MLGGGGGDGKDTLPADLRLAFDSVMVASGFGPHCLPGSCSCYIASLGADGVAALLGSVEVREEAVLPALAHGYFWSVSDSRIGAVRVVADGFELVVERLVSGCAPVQVNRLLVRVTTAGVLTVLDDDVWSREEDACIQAASARSRTRGPSARVNAGARRGPRPPARSAR